MSHLPHCKATSSFQPYAATMTRDYSRNQGLIPVLCRMYAATVVNSKKEREDLRPCLSGRRSKEGSCRERVYPRLGFSSLLPILAASDLRMPAQRIFAS